ncbi:glycine betaine ABC transporter substrate-binding protein [Sorangium sp. So ce388]|uniref:glycine betaine ABC transporter substrate-binding protein n=1 Tax=Sorangium sp. So ce388 TaxID=3133309 RepID=UPI003F5CB60A
MALLAGLRQLFAAAFTLLALLAWALPASAAEDCGKVRLSDIGWTDITATTAVASVVLQDLGYESRVDLLSIPVTFESLKNDDVDVFLGNWMPAQADGIKPYLESGAVVDLGVNLEGAIYTFAVPRYVSDAGVTSAAHLAAHKDKFKGNIYGIAPGSAANRMVLGMIQQDVYGLKGFTLVESSEQGMLGEVSQAVANKEWIVFFGWRPHPMNTQLDMTYLADPLEKWGPGGGASVVRTVASKGFVERCPDLVKLFRSMKFTAEMENVLMGHILDEKMAPEVAARAWLRAHPEQAEAWKSGVPPPREASPRATTPRAPLTQAETPAETARKLPLGDWIERGTRVITARFAGQFRAASRAVSWLLEGSVRLLLLAPPLLLIGAAALLAYALRRRVALSAAVLAGGLLIWNLGYWQPTLETLVLVLMSTTLSLLVGVPLGVVAARRPRFYAALRLLLDLMQTIPTFVYLIPTLMLFGLGVVPGLLSTVVFVLPAPIRLTYLGITSVPREIIEAGEAFGARPMQRLMKIEIPHALPTIMEGVTQALMLSLSMVVVAALVGAGGLGSPVVRALNTVDIRQGFEAGLVIVILAILLDRTFKHDRPQRTFS